MCVLVCLFVARTTVHVQRIHSVVVRTYKRPKGRFILHFLRCDSPMRDGLRRICDVAGHRKPSQNPFRNCVFVGLRTPYKKHLVAVSIGPRAAGVRVRGNPYVYNDCPGSAGLGNASLLYHQQWRIDIACCQ